MIWGYLGYLYFRKLTYSYIYIQIIHFNVIFDYKPYIWGYLYIYIYSTYKPSISPSSAHLIGLGWLGAFQLLHLRLPEHPVRAPGPEMGRWLGLCWFFTSFIPCKISCVLSGTVLYHFGFRTNVLKWL